MYVLKLKNGHFLGRQLGYLTSVATIGQAVFFTTPKLARNFTKSHSFMEARLPLGNYQGAKVFEIILKEVE